MSRSRVLVYRELPPDQLARIRAEHEVTLADPSLPEQEAAFFEALGSASGMIGALYPVGSSLLARAPALRVVSSVSVGLDAYDQAALAARGIVLCHTPGVLDEAVADLLMGMVLAIGRRIPELVEHVRTGAWARHVEPDLYGWDVHGKTLGVLGYGRIGHAVARRAALGFGMPVLYCARSPRASGLPGGAARQVSLPELLSESDFLVVVLPLTEQTRGLLGAAELSLMKPGAFLVNAGRGAVIQEDALVRALDAERLRGAALDVFVTEPLPGESPLRTHPKVLPLPHVGSATHETRHAMAEMATSNLLMVLRGEPPLAAQPVRPQP
ncbi:D-glycerate dehydrogenase [Castellaniella sp. GW247-6E4]|uniref:2-hydroxyacid dehydrogenase n=1 Tax=Castellaniella sp. GW247-6E4 TaxID=3140380 RepID=UPI003315A2BC